MNALKVRFTYLVRRQARQIPLKLGLRLCPCLYLCESGLPGGVNKASSAERLDCATAAPPPR